MPVAKKIAVATMLASESIDTPLRPLPDVQPPAALEPKPMSTPGDEQHGGDQQLRAAVEGVGQPAVAVEVGTAGDQRERRAAGDQADEEPSAPVEGEAAAPDALDHVGVRAGDAEPAVEQQAQRDDAEPEHRAADVPRELVVEHARNASEWIPRALRWRLWRCAANCIFEGRE
jgi:hypothetical protein